MAPSHLQSPDALERLCDHLVDCLRDEPPAVSDWPSSWWEAFQYAALVHGVGPLLAAEERVLDQLPPEVRPWFEEQLRNNRLRLARLQAELREILAAFAESGVPVMPLKGAILAERLYAEPGLRPMADLDLLIRPADFERSRALLEGLGYGQTVRHWKHTEFLKPDNRAVASMTGEHPDNPRGVELHLACRESFGGPTIDLSGRMWQAARQGTLLERTCTLPSDEALWLHLLIHATYHFWQGKGRLIYLVDIGRLTPLISDPVATLSLIDGRYTYPTLALLERTFPGRLPPAVREQSQRELSPRFRRWAENLTLVSGSYLNPRPPGLYLSRALRFSEGRPSEVLQALRFSLLPRPEALALDHPRLAASSLPWLAYCLLPLDWGRRLLKGRSS